MSSRSTTDPHTQTAVPWRLGAATATAGLVGPPLFVVGVIVQQAYRGAGYSPARQTISALTAGVAGWVQQLNFVVFGVLLIGFAAGLHRGIAPTRYGIIGPALLGINGLQLIIAGIFPLRQNDTGTVYDPLGVHSANGALFFVSLGVPLILLSLRMRRDPQWRPLAGYVFVSGVALIAAVLLVLTLVRPAASALHPWEGIAQRALVLIWFAALVGMALRLRRRDAGAEPAGQAEDTPPWVKRFGIAIAIVVALIAAMMFFGGQHGPGMHAGTGAPRAVVDGGSR